MRKRKIILGIILIVLGIISLMEALFEVNFSRFIFPLILIGIGLLIIFRHQLAGPGVELRMPVIGDIRKSGAWDARKHEICWFVGSAYLDFSKANFPEDDAQVKLFAFVNDVNITLPKDVGMHLKSLSFLSEYHGITKREERFLGVLEDKTDNYSMAEKRVEILVNGFIADIHVKSI